MGGSPAATGGTSSGGGSLGGQDAGGAPALGGVSFGGAAPSGGSASGGMPSGGSPPLANGCPDIDHVAVIEVTEEDGIYLDNDPGDMPITALVLSFGQCVSLYDKFADDAEFARSYSGCDWRPLPLDPSPTTYASYEAQVSDSVVYVRGGLSAIRIKDSGCN